MTETIPPDALVGLALEDGVRELSVEESRRVLERYPELLFRYRKWTGMTRTRGRLIVIDQRRVSEILTWLDSASSGPHPGPLVSLADSRACPRIPSSPPTGRARIV